MTKIATDMLVNLKTSFHASFMYSKLMIFEQCSKFLMTSLVVIISLTSPFECIMNFKLFMSIECFYISIISYTFNFDVNLATMI